MFQLANLGKPFSPGNNIRIKKIKIEQLVNSKFVINHNSRKLSNAHVAGDCLKVSFRHCPTSTTKFKSLRLQNTQSNMMS